MKLIILAGAATAAYIVMSPQHGTQHTEINPPLQPITSVPTYSVPAPTYTPTYTPPAPVMPQGPNKISCSFCAHPGVWMY